MRGLSGGANVEGRRAKERKSRSTSTATAIASRHSAPLRTVSASPVQADKPSVTFIYRVVVSPRLRKAWVPKDKFLSYYLSALLNELAFEGKVTGLLFSIEGAGLSMWEQIPPEELQFEATKQYFKRRIGAWLANRRGSGESLLVMEIEALRDDGTTRKELQDMGFLDW
ncbi:hypothetical protein ACJ41O_010060 [Fusarium nematophilum]